MKKSSQLLESIMQASFMVSPTSELYQSKLAAQSHLILLPYLPRAKRKALRVVTPKAVPAAPTQQDIDNIITHYLAIHDPLNETHTYNANTVDPDMDITGAVEFCDYDDEHDGLTIHEPENEEELIAFLNGYNIL
jgi:hypothetical protein